MEVAHRDMLLTQRANLVDNMNMRGGLLTQLLARKVIDQRSLRVIKTNRTLDEQAEELLDTLPQCGSKAFTLFCEALTADGQGELVTLYLQADKSDRTDNQASQEQTDKCRDGQQGTGTSGSKTDNLVPCIQESGPSALLCPQGQGQPCQQRSGIMGNVSRESTPQRTFEPDTITSPRDDNTDGAMGYRMHSTIQDTRGRQPVTIREEFQQKIYRRDIEAGSFPTGQGYKENNLRNESGYDRSLINTRNQYEHRDIMRDTQADSSYIYSVLADPSFSAQEKEHFLLKYGIPPNAQLENMLDAIGQNKFSKFDPLLGKDYMQSKYDSLIVKDSGASPRKPNIESSVGIDRLHERITQPGVFNNPNNLSQTSRPYTRSNHPSTGFQVDLPSSERVADIQRRQTFQQRELIGDSWSHNPEIRVTYPDRISHFDSSKSVSSPLKSPRKEHTNSIRENIPKDIFREISSRSESPARRPFSDVQRNPLYSPKVEREFLEIPRYIETNGSEEDGRRFLNHHRHVERALPVSQDPDLLYEEQILREGNHAPPRLARNDSVDTMHKRPSTDDLENVNDDRKRFREDVDSVPVSFSGTMVTREPANTLSCRLKDTALPSVSSINTLPSVESVTNLQQSSELAVPSIPVIEDPRRVPYQPRVVVPADVRQEKTQRSSLLGAMDDPEIDLTDGPINVKVELSTRQFYLQYYKKAYAMRRIPRGKALILNVNAVVGKAERRGTDIDRDNLHNLLCQLHFDVTVFNDSDGLTALEMVKKLQSFSQHGGHALADCTVVCILSHGEEGYIFGSDGRKFELDAVFSLFDNTCCPDLRGKPKMFIIQACRGGALDRGVQYYPDEHDGSDPRVRQVPSMSDMLICYPTQNGYYAWRNRDRGSWYVEALVQVFMKYAQSEDVCTMLNRVNLLVSKKVSHCPNLDMDQMSQMSEYKSTLRMPHLFFFPGIGGC